MPFSSEFDMYPHIEEFLRRDLRCCQTDQDVSFRYESGTRTIDVVGLVREDDGTPSEIIAVEAKADLGAKNIRDIFGQAEDDRQVAHEVYVAFPKNLLDAYPSTSNEIKRKCRDKNMGLLVVNGKICKAVFSPERLPQPDPEKVREIVSKFKYEVTSFEGFCFKDFSRTSLFYEKPSEYQIVEKKLERLVKEVVEHLQTRKLNVLVLGKLGWKRRESEMGSFNIAHVEGDEIKGIPFIIGMNNRELFFRVEAKRPGYTKTDLDRIIRKLNDDPSLLRENLDKLSELSDPESGYRLCVNYSGTYERKHDFMINLHLWNQDDPSSFSSFINILKFSRERCAGTRFTPYMVIEFHYEMPEAFGKKKNLVDDIPTRISQLEETAQLFWELLKYEWE